MNPLFEHDLLQTRRQFFGDVGLRARGHRPGPAAWAQSAGAPRGGSSTLQCTRPAGLAALPAEGEVAHLSAHERRAVADRPLGLQAAARRSTSTRSCPTASATGQRITTMTSGQTRFPVAPSKFKFAQHGQVRHVGQRAAAAHGEDRRRHRARSRSVHTNAINHDPACTFVMTGSEVPGKPSIGSWLSYGLGSESNDLPAFVVFTPDVSPRPGHAQALFTRMWGSGFLPTALQRRGAARRRRSGPLPARTPPASTTDDRRAMLDALGS